MAVLRIVRKNRALLRKTWGSQRPWILLALLSMMILFTGQELMYGRFDLRQAFIDYYTNLSAELLSIALALSVISALSHSNERRLREEQHEKANLIKRLPIADPAEKRLIVAVLRENDYLIDGTFHDLRMSTADLQSLDFSYADLSGINLAAANLHKTDLSHSNLHGASLSRASLRFARCEGARLIEANLSHADLRHADFTEADLRYARFDGADLRGTILDEADLRGANLQDANLCGACLELQYDGTPFSVAKLDGSTILPDGTLWQPDSDLRRFTDSDHEEFWDIAARRLADPGAGAA